MGAASILAWQGENLGQVAIVMTLFGLGAAAPLLLIGTLSREALIRWRGKISSAGHVGKMIFGVLVIVVGLSTVTGVDRALEAWLVQNSPAWMTYWSTRVLALQLRSSQEGLGPSRPALLVEPRGGAAPPPGPLQARIVAAGRTDPRGRN